MELTSHALLFSALVNELRLPLLQMNRLSEMDTPGLAEEITLISQQALRLVDAYTLAISKQQLRLEPLNVRNLLHETAQELLPLARLADVTVSVDERVSTVPVLAHRDTVQALLTLVATSFIHNPTERETRNELVLASHRLPGGVMLGAFSNQTTVLSQALAATRQLHGRAHQAVPELGQAGSASLAIADCLGMQMSAPLKTYRHNNLAGIGSLLMPTSQLHFSV